MRNRKKLKRISLYILSGLIAIFAVGFGWYQLQLRPVDSHGGYQLFTVSLGESVPQVGSQLQAKKLIRSKDAFVTYILLHDLRGSLKAGEFSISSSQSTGRIVSELSHSGPSANELTVPPGATLSDIEALAAGHGISPSSFQAALDSPHTQAILATKPSTASLEGYLYPDTYDLGTGVSADQLVNTMITNLGNHVTSSLVQQFAAEGLTFHQGLTLASIVEKEAAGSTDQEGVAQVFLLRLKDNMPLGSDVTAIYAAKLAGVPFSTSIDSPYNTLIVTGLPPGPICNPDLGALEAVAHPASADYLYFLAGKDGKIHYAHTYAEHLQNIKEYL